jgi:hypothetical protein
MLTAAKSGVHPFSYAPVSPEFRYLRGMNGDHERCRHLVWRNTPDEPGIEPGPYCRNDLGVFPLLDCPVLQGRTCARFERREGDPRASSETELRDLAAILAADYLGWRYWRRVRALAGEEIDASPPEASAAPPPRERYPGEKRSEERLSEEN